MPPRLKLAAALLLALSSSRGASAASSSSSSSAVSWCADSSASAVLTYCGDACSTNEPCVQYASNSSCSEASRNDCVVHSSSCTYQCLENAFNTLTNKFTVFAKTPLSTDVWSTSSSGSSAAAFPSAKIDSISGVHYYESTRNIQITGFDAINIQKGSLQEVSFGDSPFSTASALEQLILTNLDLATLPTDFIPTEVALLSMENCNMDSLPSQLGNLAGKNLRTLKLNKNLITNITDSGDDVAETLKALTTLDLTENDITTFDVVLPAITTLDLSGNKLTAFPSVIFNMSTLNILNLTGNSIDSVTVTATQYNFLRKLDSTSTLDIISSSCASGANATEVLDSVVCVSNGTPATTDESTSSSSSSHTLVIVVVVLAVVVVIGVVGFFLYRRRMKRGGFYLAGTPNNMLATPQSSNNNTPGSRGRGTMGSRGRASSQQRPPTAASRTGSSIPNIFANLTDKGKMSDAARPRGSSAQTTFPAGADGNRSRHSIINPNVAHIPSDEINYTRTIAKGAFGEVWLASYGKDLVAVKKLLTVEGTSVQDFVSELNLLASLSHRCILTLVGACWDEDLTDIQIVMEYMDDGDLLSVLRRSSPSVLTWENGKATYCVQICEAVYYLHSLQPALIHRDIKSRNILVDSEKGAKLSDFGESRERTVARTMTAGVGTARWVAPEIILGEDYSELADIYSLGVLLTELDTHQIPYQKMGLEESMIVQQVAVGKLRPKVSDTCPEIIRRLTHECLQYDPSLRPSAARVLQTLMASPLVRRPSTLLTTD